MVVSRWIGTKLHRVRILKSVRIIGPSLRWGIESRRAPHDEGHSIANNYKLLIANIVIIDIIARPLLTCLRCNITISLKGKSVPLRKQFSLHRSHYCIPGYTLGAISLYRINCPHEALRIPDSYDAKICNLWTFWPEIQLITGQNVQRLQIFAIFAS